MTSAVLTAFVLLVGGCAADGSTPPDGTGAGDPSDGAGQDGSGGDPPAGGAAGSDDSGPGTEPDGGDADPDAPGVDPAEVGANELGRIPVIMYHRVLGDGGSDYDLTAEEYRTELEWLFDNGYRPVRTVDLVRGHIDVSAGTTPVVLTFDDSTREQAALTDDGELDPDTALGILVEVAADRDDVEPHASVYVVTSSLFGGTADGPRIVAVLHHLGMEIGNHTHTHRNLGGLQDEEVEEELARAAAEIRALVPDAEVATLSLPLGAFPEDRQLAVGGSSEAGSYEHEGVLLVGAEPSRSPFHAGFDPLALPRIRSSPSWDPEGEPDYGSRFWLDWLDAEEGRRYVSDGDPETVSFPAELSGDLDPRFEARANPY